MSKIFQFYCPDCKASFKSVIKPMGDKIRCPLCLDVGHEKPLIQCTEVPTEYTLTFAPKDETT